MGCLQAGSQLCVHICLSKWIWQQYLHVTLKTYLLISKNSLSQLVCSTYLLFFSNFRNSYLIYDNIIVDLIKISSVIRVIVPPTFKTGWFSWALSLVYTCEISASASTSICTKRRNSFIFLRLYMLFSQVFCLFTSGNWCEW